MGIGGNKIMIPIITASIMRIHMVKSMIIDQNHHVVERLLRLKERNIN
jgi:hypothetical protein